MWCVGHHLSLHYSPLLAHLPPPTPSMGYLSCRADSSLSTCRSISSLSPQPRNRPADASPPQSFHLFTYAELEAATCNFAPSALLGRGSHGAVYRADLPASRPLAVKRPSRRPSHEADNEIDILSHICSPRLVNLVGFTPPSTSTTVPRLLVVEFMPNGTLYDLLHSSPRPLSWTRRLRLALQSALALLTLHSVRPPIIHRDIKSANILIDHRHNARLGDFGLALRHPATRSTPPAGTLGYLDPSYLTPDNLSTKTDVFSFGILLLEIMSGRKAIDIAYSPPSVVDWAVPLLKKGKLSSLFDPRIPPPNYPAGRQLAALAASCVRSNERRPSMAEVVGQLKILSKTVPARAWNGNPCAVVDTERTLSRLERNCDVSVSPRCEEEASASAEEEVVIPTLRNGSKVFSDKSMKGGGNLKELMARLDIDPIAVLGVASRRARIGRARTVRVTGNYHDRAEILRLWRNRSIKEGVCNSLPRLKELDSSDSRLGDRAGVAL